MGNLSQNFRVSGARAYLSLLEYTYIYSVYMNVIECVRVCLCVCVGYERNYMIYLEGLGFPPQEKAEIRNLKIMS